MGANFRTMKLERMKHWELSSNLVPAKFPFSLSKIFHQDKLQIYHSAHTKVHHNNINTILVAVGVKLCSKLL